MPVWRCSWLYHCTKSAKKHRASARQPKRSGKVGAYLRVLNQASLYGLSLETFGRECDLVTSKSDSSAATVLEVIDVPRSAWTTCGTPWTPKISFIISTANGPDSWACTTAPTMYRE